MFPITAAAPSILDKKRRFAANGVIPTVLNLDAHVSGRFYGAYSPVADGSGVAMLPIGGDSTVNIRRKRRYTASDVALTIYYLDACISKRFYGVFCRQVPDGTGSRDDV